MKLRIALNALVTIVTGELTVHLILEIVEGDCGKFVVPILGLQLLQHRID